MTRIPILLLAFTLAGCNSSDSAEEPDPPQLPEISSFTASASSILAEDGVTLLAVFTNGASGQIDNGVGEVFSNGPVTVFPAASTTYTLTVTNEDGEASASIDVNVDEAPILTVTEPLDHTVARSELPVTASCSDDRGDCEISVWTEDGLTIASGTNELSLVLDLSEFEGQSIGVYFEVDDSAGQHDRAPRRVYVESSPGLASEKGFPGLVIDFDGQRALVEYAIDLYSDLSIVDVASGREENVDVPGLFEIRQADLTPTGAAFAGLLEGDIGFSEAYDWNHSLLVRLGLGGSLQVTGDYATWDDEVEAGFLRRQFSTMTDLRVYGLATCGHSVASNGVVAFSGRASFEAHCQIMKFDAGVTTTLTADADRDNRYPRTDDQGVVYFKDGAAGYEIAFHDGTDEYILTDPRGDFPEPGSDYAIAGGWVVFTALGDLGQTQVWTRDPAGTLLQRTAFDVDSRIESLAPDGEVMVVTEDARYLSRPTGELTQVSSELGQKSTKIGDTWYVMIGRSVFEVP